MYGYSYSNVIHNTVKLRSKNMKEINDILDKVENSSYKEQLEWCNIMIATNENKELLFFLKKIKKAIRI